MTGNAVIRTHQTSMERRKNNSIPTRQTRGGGRQRRNGGGISTGRAKKRQRVTCGQPPCMPSQATRQTASGSQQPATTASSHTRRVLTSGRRGTAWCTRRSLLPAPPPQSSPSTPVRSPSEQAPPSTSPQHSHTPNTLPAASTCAPLPLATRHPPPPPHHHPPTAAGATHTLANRSAWPSTPNDDTAPTRPASASAPTSSAPSSSRTAGGAAARRFTPPRVASEAGGGAGEPGEPWGGSMREKGDWGGEGGSRVAKCRPCAAHADAGGRRKAAVEEPTSVPKSR